MPYKSIDRKLKTASVAVLKSMEYYVTLTLSPPKLSVSIQSSGSRDSGVDCIFQVLASDICSTPIGYVSS